MTIPLEYLTRFNEQSCLDSNLDMAWKGYVVNIINELDKEGYIQEGSAALSLWQWQMKV